jgi:biotin carboxyl carrier protein
VRAAHQGFQVGMALLKLPILVGQDAGFHGLSVDERLEPVVPEAFADPERAARLHRALAPPPPARSNEIVAWTGGTFYARPAPDTEPYVRAGSHVRAGDAVGILEVMKMFNPIRAEVSGTITRVLVEAGAGQIVSKGQPLFEIDPDEPLARESEEAAQARRREKTRSLLERL